MVNPAFVAIILAAAAEGYRKETGQSMPWSLSFVVVPMVLHLPTRRALPASTRTHLSTWTAKHPIVRAGFPARARELVEPVKEGTRFGLEHGALKLETEGRLRSAYRKRRSLGTPAELALILRKASLVGRWLAKVDSPVTVFALLGVAP